MPVPGVPHRAALASLLIGLAGACGPAEPRPATPPAEHSEPRPGARGGPAAATALDFPAGAGVVTGATPAGCTPLPDARGPTLALQLARLEVQKHLVYSPNGALVASTGMMRRTQIWDGKTGQLRLTLDDTGSAEEVAFDPTSTWVAAVAHDDVVAWQLETGRRRVLFAAPGAYEVAISPDGRTLATTHRGSIRTWTREGKSLATMPIGVERAAFSPDGARLISWERNVSVDKTVTAWDAATGAKLWSRSGSAGSAGGHAAWSPDGSEVAWIPDGPEIELLEARTGKTKRRLSGGREIEEVGYALAGSEVRVVAREGHDKRSQVILWDAASGRRLASHTVAGIRGIEVSADRKRVAIRSAFDAAYVLDATSTQPPVEVVRDSNEVWQVAVHPTEKRIAVTGHGRAPVIADQLDGKRTVGALPVFDVVEMSLSADGATLATLQNTERGWDTEARLWNAHTGALKGSLERKSTGKDGPPVYTHVQMSPAGDRVAASLMGRVDLFDGAGRFERTAEAFPKYRTELPLAFSRDGRRLAIVGGPRDTVRIYDPRVGIVAEHEGRIGRIGALAFSPDQRRIALGSTGKVAIIDVASGAEVALLKGEFREVDALVWRDDRTLFTGNQTGTIARATLGGAVEIFKAHRERLNDLAVSPDGKLLASAAEDRVLRVWNAETMQPIAETTFDERAAEGAAFHPTAPIVFSAGGPVRAMRIPDGAVVSLYMVRSGNDLAGLAVSAGGLFGGDEKAFAAIRFAPAEARATAPLAWFDAVPTLRRPALVDDLARGCPMARDGRAP